MAGISESSFRMFIFVSKNVLFSVRTSKIQKYDTTQVENCKGV